MSIKNKISEIYSLEQLSAQDTVVHRLHPLGKIFCSFVFIITVISFDRFDFSRLIPFVFFPAILIPLSQTPFKIVFKRLLIVLPFCLFIGISNILIERDIAFTFGNISVSYGVLSFFSIIFRACLCITAVIILIASTSFFNLTSQLRKLHIPEIFIIMFEMTYRYIGVLFNETASLQTAYNLRSAGKKGIVIRHAGAFIGSLLLRSFDRADHIYSAMQCRGYSLGKENPPKRKMRKADIFYCTLVCSLCLFFRFFDIGKFLNVAY